MVSFDAKIARPGRLAAACRLATAPRLRRYRTSFPRRGAPCVPGKAL